MLSFRYTHYNFACVHQKLRATAAMKEGMADQIWSLDGIAELMR